MVEPSTVYVVTERRGEGGDPGEALTYWAHVYLSRGHAVRGVEYWASKAAQPITWEELSAGVLVARDPHGTEVYKIVPFGVRHDTDAEE